MIVVKEVQFPLRIGNKVQFQMHLGLIEDLSLD